MPLDVATVFTVMATYFQGVGLGGYRCFGDHLQFIAPLDRVNVLIGPNNSGKSTSLNFFHRHLQNAYVALSNPSTFSLEDEFQRQVIGEDPPIPFRMAWPLDPLKYDAVRANESTGTLVKRYWDLLCSSPNDWPQFELTVLPSTSLHMRQEFLDRILASFTPVELENLCRTLTNQSSSDTGLNVQGIAHYAVQAQWFQPPPEIAFIPAHRALTRDVLPGTTSQPWDLSGAGLVLSLDKLWRTEPHERTQQIQHERIIDETKRVLELSDFRYSIASSSQKLLFHIDGEPRLLEAVGTGYEHVFLIIVASIIAPHKVLCIEEPEVNLHPRLQRRLAEYLVSSTENQLLISTHSATLIDSLRGNTFRLTLQQPHTTFVTRPIEHQVLDAFDELGYRASDLLQTNCVVWVEGPSDRIYLNAWIAALDDGLVEGVDYQVMFYGGSLLSHLTLDGDSPEDHIPLTLLNQRFVLVADSDMQSDSDDLRESLRRICDEAEGNSRGFVWVTAGRTIENYLPVPFLSGALGAFYPSAAFEAPADQWANPTLVMREGKAIEVDKVRLARTLVAAAIFPDALDLKERIRQVVNLIRDRSG